MGFWKWLGRRFLEVFWESWRKVRRMVAVYSAMLSTWFIFLYFTKNVLLLFLGFTVYFASVVLYSLYEYYKEFMEVREVVDDGSV